MQYRVKWLYLLVSALISAGVLGLFLRILPTFPKYDAVMHFFSGVAIALAIAAFIPRVDVAIVLIVFIAGFVWEPFEWWYFLDLHNYTLQEWMTREDTLFDITLVVLGGVLLLIPIGRLE